MTGVYVANVADPGIVGYVVKLVAAWVLNDFDNGIRGKVQFDMVNGGGGHSGGDPANGCGKRPMNVTTHNADHV